MKLIIKNDSKETVKNPNVKIIETTEASFTNQTVFIEENDVPIIKYTDTESMYFVKDLDNLYDRKSRSEVLLDITIDNLELIGSGSGSGSGGEFIPLTGTEPGSPVTGDIEMQEYIKLWWKNGDYLLSLENVDKYLYLQTYNPITGYFSKFTIDGDTNNFRIETNNPNSVGLIGVEDFSERDPNNKLIYTQRSYVDNAISNIDFSPKFSEIVIEAETDGIEIPITGGTYMVYNFRGQTIYRYITTATNANGYPIEDSFYDNLTAGVLSNKITQRNQ